MPLPQSQWPRDGRCAEATNRISMTELESLLFPGCRQGRVSAVIGAYCDESTDPQAQRVLTLAAYTSITQDWIWQFEPLWEALLKRHGLSYFRASDCESGAGPFAKFRSNPLPANLTPEDKQTLSKIKTEFVDLAISQPYMYGWGVNVFVQDFHSILQSEPRVRGMLGEEPYLIAYQVLLSKIGLMVKEFNEAQGEGYQRHMVAFIFDMNEEMKYRVLTQYDRFQAANPESSTWMASLTFADDKKVLELQAADNLAFEIRKDCFNRLFDRERPERKALTRLKHKIAIIYDLDYRSLKALVDHNLNISSISPIQP